jgi:hypothetical protein
VFNTINWGRGKLTEKTLFAGVLRLRAVGKGQVKGQVKGTSDEEIRLFNISGNKFLDLRVISSFSQLGFVFVVL